MNAATPTSRLAAAEALLDEVAREMHHWRVFMAGAYRCHPSCLRCHIDAFLRATAVETNTGPTAAVPAHQSAPSSRTDSSVGPTPAPPPGEPSADAMDVSVTVLSAYHSCIDKSVAQEIHRAVAHALDAFAHAHAARAAEEERERCAKVCEAVGSRFYFANKNDHGEVATACAAAIRALAPAGHAKGAS